MVKRKYIGIPNQQTPPGVQQGFVFLDDASRPYKVALWNNKPWLFYWHPDGFWVSLKEIDQAVALTYERRKLPDDQAELYDQAHEKYIGGRPPH